jgi:hypothetical protein
MYQNWLEMLKIGSKSPEMARKLLKITENNPNHLKFGSKHLKFGSKHLKIAQNCSKSLIITHNRLKNTPKTPNFAHFFPQVHYPSQWHL